MKNPCKNCLTESHSSIERCYGTFCDTSCEYEWLRKQQLHQTESGAIAHAPGSGERYKQALEHAVSWINEMMDDLVLAKEPTFEEVKRLNAQINAILQGE